MAIDFFQATCQSTTDETVFGIYDVQHATLLFTNSEDWHVWVDNPNGKVVSHTAIDDCLGIPRLEGERCESMVIYDDVLTFIELKDRDGGRWAGKARDQLINTIALFKRDADISVFTRYYGHIANKQRPNFKAGGKNFSQQFEDETGFILRVSDVIKIE
jgi:metal-dependent hydrolase (beta-lactamase superfamily II)